MESTTTRLFPAHRAGKTIASPLSILDATVARFSATGAIWLFDSLPNGVSEIGFLDKLKSSLVDTLGEFPQWTGQLQWSPARYGGLHTERYNRPMIVYGDSTDPGVEWRVVQHPTISVKSLAPTPSERASGSGVWAGDEFAQTLFLSNTLLPLHDLCEFEGLPGMQVQVNMFGDGGYGIGIKMAHCLADAQALMVFMHQWAASSRRVFSSDNTSSIMDLPVFDPPRLDACAAGDIDAMAADPGLISAARQLPLHRFDWWKTDDRGYPKFAIPTTENSRSSSEGLAQTELSPSTSASWTTWHFAAEVKYVQLHFTGAELDRLKQRARADSCPDISRLDALLAHIWAAINRARGHVNTSEEVFLDFTLGARARVPQPLPDSFLGSPLFITHIGMTGASACASSLGETASQIRQTMQLFTPEKLGAMLHDAAYEVSPDRLWQAFLGTRHTLVTSWLRLNVYGVDFVGFGQRPRYVHAVMPKMDGCLQVMDSGVDDNGIDIALYLEADALERLLCDNLLRPSSG